MLLQKQEDRGKMKRYKKAFSLTEILVVIAIIGILGLIVGASLSRSIVSAKIAKIVNMANTLQAACEAYYIDTGEYASEAGVSVNQSYCNHQLTNNNCSVGGWKGPYLKRPLLSSDNPFLNTGPSESVAVLGSLGNGFDLDGDGVIDRNGSGNEMHLNSNSFALDAIMTDVARQIDNAFDYGVPSNCNGCWWGSTGRVLFDPASKFIDIYLTGGMNN